MKIYPITLFFLGVIMAIIGYYKQQDKPKQKIIYKFVDQTIDEAQKGREDEVHKTFIKMFIDPPLLT